MRLEIFERIEFNKLINYLESKNLSYREMERLTGIDRITLKNLQNNDVVVSRNSTNNKIINFNRTHNL